MSRGPGKGVSGNPKGNHKRTPHKGTQVRIEMLRELCEKNDIMGKLFSKLEELDPRDQVKFYIEILNYLMPKQSSIQADVKTMIQSKIEEVRKLFPTADEVNRSIDK